MVLKEETKNEEIVAVVPDGESRNYPPSETVGKQKAGDYPPGKDMEAKPGDCPPGENDKDDVKTKPGDCPPGENDKDDVKTKPGDCPPGKDDEHDLKTKPGDCPPGKKNDDDSSDTDVDIVGEGTRGQKSVS